MTGRRRLESLTECSIPKDVDLMDIRVAGIVFAGGKSKRMGRHKALLPYHGSTFLETIVKKMERAGIDPVLVVIAGAHVTSSHAEQIIRGTKLTQETFFVARSPNFVRAGVEALMEKAKQAEAIVMCPVDVPSIQVQSLRALALEAAQSGASIVHYKYGSKVGVSLAVSRQFLPWVLRLSPVFFRTGFVWSVLRCLYFGPLIVTGRCRLRFLPTDDPGAVQNINTPQDFFTLKEN